ncbi:MAG: hypothetical protein A2277_04440 [Desulfobacterales bacterium RIFOXYA12_FULL_46_15]|nr:MAG: hypothetical protein A2277_04440 [Desulfobacterales bacterium RIFOXYA12_FULL_46_15]
MNPVRLQFDKKDEKTIVYRGFVVMTAEERPYIDALIAPLQNLEINEVLEVGFGLGISAESIQKTISPLEVHDIVEVEKSIFEDLCVFSMKYENVNPLHGDVYTYKFNRTYDLIFFDSFDYSLSFVNQGEYDEIEDSNETKRARQLLKKGGIYCHPYFGDMDMPEIHGFRLVRHGEIKVPPFLLWDGSECAMGQIGYYIKL